MANAFSISRLSSFEQCRLQYKYRYIDRVPSVVEGIEAFMGSRVHEALQALYDLVKLRTVQSREWLESVYDDLWRKNASEALKIVKAGRTSEDYREFGKKCLGDYYQTYQPFDQAKVVKTEEFIEFPVSHGGRTYRFCGVLDRLDWNDRENIFEIHDYKTSGTLPSQEEADTDPQLGLYHLAVRSKWPEAEKVKLVWHYLAFNKQLESSRGARELDALQETIINRIEEVEACRDFPPTRSTLCEWCGYQSLCPMWKHPLAAAELPANTYLQDPGVKLVMRYAELEAEKEELQARIFGLEQELALVEEAALALAAKDGLRVIDGPDHRLFITIRDEWAAPIRREHEREWEELRSLLLKENRYIDVSTVNSQMLTRMLREWPAEFRDKVQKFLVLKKVRKAELKPKK